MPELKLKTRQVKRTAKRVLLLLLLATAAVVAYGALASAFTAGAEATYASYAVTTGDVQTSDSFSATLSVQKTETFSASEACSVRTIYVRSGDAVQKGDALMQLSTGELFTASFDGVVNEIRVKAGDWLWPNFNVVQVSDLSHLDVSMSVDEYDVKRLSVGQACTVRVISLGVDFETTISHIDRVSTSSGTLAFYTVTCDLTVPENVLPGMQATVTLAADAAQGVTLVPMDALAFDENDAPYVLLKDADGGYVRQAIQTGLSDGMHVQVTQGLTDGQTVYALRTGEGAEQGFSLSDIYAFLFGRRVVIEEGSAGGGEPPTGGMPEGMALPDGATPPEGLTAGQAGDAAVTELDASADAAAQADAAAESMAAATDAPAESTADAQSTATPAERQTGSGAAPGMDGSTPPSRDASGEGESNGQ